MRPRRTHSSLKHHLGILGGLTLVLLAATLGLAILLLRQTESARLHEADRLLTASVDELVRRYDDVRGAFADPRLPSHVDSQDENVLQAVTQATLAGVPGAEGGFYAVEGHRFVGYAYPTYPGSGRKTDVPAAERNTIERVVLAAVSQSRHAVDHVAAGSDVILFHARPLPRHGDSIAAAWVMTRLSGLHGTPSVVSTMAMLGALVLAAVIPLTAWLTIRRLDAGVATVEAGLSAMEKELGRSLPPIGIEELDRIGSAISRLGMTLEKQQADRRELEQRLHHADRLAAVGRLVAGVAHELRNPLASIKLKLQLLERGPLNEERVSGTRHVLLAEVGKLDRLVQRLLTLAKPQAAPTVTDVSRFLAERLEPWRVRAEEQGAAVTCEVDPAVNTLSLDRDRLGQILDNLVANALDAVKDRSGRVLIQVARDEGHQVVLRVVDNGPGLPADVLERLFEPFVTTRAEGTGLGLFLSAELARALGGHLHYTGSSAGARFELRWPC